MKGIIWSKFTPRAVMALRFLDQDYRNQGIEPVEMKPESDLSDIRIIKYDNGDEWQIVAATTTSRGYRCNLSYIDSEINPEIVKTIIKPATTALPFNGFNYF